MTQVNPVIMRLTPAAERFIGRMMRFNADAKAGFRLKVRPGGCSGVAVEFDLATEPALDEVVWEDGKLRIFLDGASCLLLNEAVVDFVDSRSLTGCVVTMPGGAVRACSSASTLVPVEALMRR